MSDDISPLPPGQEPVPSPRQSEQKASENLAEIPTAHSEEFDPAIYAVPEFSPGRKRSAEPRIVVPEASDEDEEKLVYLGEHSGAQAGPFSGDRFEKWFVLLLFFFGSLTVMVSSVNVGMSWDEAYYVSGAQKTLEWARACLAEKSPPVAGPELEYYWDAFADDHQPAGHPSVTRFLTALGLAFPLFGDNTLLNMRWPIALCFGLTLAVLYLLSRKCYGRVTAWIAVVAYFFMPRVFGHAHFALTETPMVLMTVGSVYVFLKGLEQRRWAIAMGVLFGLALATKINAVFLPAILLPWAFLFHRKESVGNIYAMIFISPVIMVLSWPWLWESPLPKLARYLYWNFDHAQQGLFYFGKVYNDTTGPVPMDYPLRLLLYSLPVVTLGLVVLGLARTLRAPRHHYYGLLFLWAALVPCLPMMGSSPKYDGVRLFLTAFPFIAILAGIGGSVLVRIGAFFEMPGERIPRGRAVLSVVLLALILNGGWAMISIHPHYLTYFNILSGGRQQAFDKMEMTYWGEALNKKTAETINKIVPDGASLTPRAMNIEVLRYYQKWGWLKNTITLVEDQPADYHLLQYRRGMYADKPDRVLVNDKDPSFALVAEFPPSEEVPLMGLFQTDIIAFPAYLSTKAP